MIARLREVVTDGPLTAPRWLHHVVKVMTSLTVFVALAVAGVPIVVAGWLASAGLFAGVTLKERLWPSDPATYSLWAHVADALADSADACVTLAVAYRLAGAWVVALAIFVVCVAAWLVGNGDARP